MKRQNFSIYHFILPGIFLMLAISCKKDDDNNNQIPGSGFLPTQEMVLCTKQ
jgi:hypothetical protein